MMQKRNAKTLDNVSKIVVFPRASSAGGDRKFETSNLTQQQHRMLRMCCAEIVAQMEN